MARSGRKYNFQNFVKDSIRKDSSSREKDLFVVRAGAERVAIYCYIDNIWLSSLIAACLPARYVLTFMTSVGLTIIYGLKVDTIHINIRVFWIIHHLINNICRSIWAWQLWWWWVIDVLVISYFVILSNTRQLQVNSTGLADLALANDGHGNQSHSNDSNPEFACVAPDSGNQTLPSQVRRMSFNYLKNNWLTWDNRTGHFSGRNRFKALYLALIFGDISSAKFLALESLKCFQPNGFYGFQF